MTDKISQGKKINPRFNRDSLQLEHFFTKFFQDIFKKLAQSFHYGFQTPLIQTARNNQAGNQPNPVGKCP